MRILGVIPARYASTRFPGKPLADIAGQPMIQRVWQQARQAKMLANTVVATDDIRIFDCITGFGGTAVMTDPTHPTGTDRMGQVARLMPDYDAYINIQGDEPFISPGQIDVLCGLLSGPEVIATLVRPLTDEHDLLSANTVKVARAANGNALYFSRSPIPHLRAEANVARWPQLAEYWLHVGIYGFGRQALLQAVALPAGGLETMESLEQLRWLEAGMSIRTAITHHPSHGIDVPEDIPRVLALNGLS